MNRSGASVAEQGVEHAEQRLGVVVAGQHHGRRHGRELAQRRNGQLDVLMARTRSIEHVAGVQDHVGTVLAGCCDHSLQGAAMVSEPVYVAQRLADVPIGGVQQSRHLQRVDRRLGRAALALGHDGVGRVGGIRREREPHRDRRGHDRLIEDHRPGQKSRRALAQLRS